MKWLSLIAISLFLAASVWAQPVVDLARQMKSFSGSVSTTPVSITFGTGIYSLSISVLNLDAANILWIEMGQSTCSAATPSTKIDPATTLGMVADVTTDKLCMVTTSGTVSYQIDVAY